MSSDTKHTPGPWVACTDDAAWDRITIEQDRTKLPPGEEPSVVGEAYDSGDGIDRATAEANAALIAAAPDLLAALREARALANHFAQGGGPVPRERFDAIDAAIARAEGGGA